MTSKRIIKALKLRLKNYELSQRIDNSIGAIADYAKGLNRNKNL